MSKNRIRCAQCNKNFCKNCAAEPYHLGKTCEQYRQHKEARKCRYCGEQIKGPPPNMKPAFKDVCRKDDCIQLMNKTCDKVLACGHPCSGFKNEPMCLPCLEDDCVAKRKELTLELSKDDYCSICYV